MSSTRGTSTKSSASSTAERARRVVAVLARLYPKAECALRHSSAWELLAATILSAQCTDVRVNQVTESLFKKYPTLKAFADAELSELEQAVRPTGFYRNKAKALQGAARLLLERHGGEVPSTLEALIEIPGAARKTANVVLGTWFGTASGVVVDTHVQRITRLLGLTKSEDPKRIERDLMELLPRSDWIDFSHRLIWHGRKVCVARRPRCGECALSKDCPSARTSG
jgi:endonuclease III